MEALESALRDAALGHAAKALGTFMSVAGSSRPEEVIRCPKCRASMQVTGPRTKQILTMVGQVTYTRLRYACPLCKTVRYPGDEALDLVGVCRSPGVRRQTARLGAKEPFHEVAQDMRELAGATAFAQRRGTDF